MKPKYHAIVWALIILLLCIGIILSIILYQNGQRYSLLCNLPNFLLAGITAVTLIYTNQNRIRYIAKLNQECNDAESNTIQQLPMGMCVLDETGSILHYNHFFTEQVLNDNDLFGKKLQAQLPINILLSEQKIHWQEKYYHVTAVPYHGHDRKLTAFLWSDITELEQIQQDYKNTKPCVLIILLDSYEDLIQSAKESAKLETSVAIEKLLEDFISQTNGILKRLKSVCPCRTK